MTRRAWAAALLVWTLAFAPAAPWSGPAVTKAGQMVEITIDLQDGFKDDTVVISDGRRELIREQGVSTRFQIGKARSVRVRLPEGEVTLTIAVPTRNLSGEVAIDTAKPAFVGISVTTRHQLEIKVQAQPFGYL